MVNYFHLFLLALLGSVLALIGGVIFLFNKRLSGFLEANSVPFAAGVLITVALLGLLPEAFEAVGERAFLIILLSFFSSYLFETILFGIHHHDIHDHAHGHDHETSVPLVLVGDTIHNLIDGVAIAAGYLISPGLGLIIAISTFMHEVPHEIGDFGILLKAGWKRKKIFMVNIISASFTIVGAFMTLLFSENLVLIGTLLAIAAGIFLYLGASDFLPHAGGAKGSRTKALLPLVVGVVMMIATLSVIPHSHEQDNNDQHVQESQLPVDH